ncbi:hypothetical protein BWQ96_02570 [Gracilariopsis chorda]|uniref:Uncharacterized protein n=1 Tax=Gracilariopsis chorda TaxID=448386 RepID=A0A2V3IZM1_9FLOR|nr:hypothetical protein BWQ96_02570 [Gracilariopsis chorda]|eukprot:PXF47591.1 hypothetical protein BWQ96_02570 [Gracilariopsis chorda]
MLQKASKRQLYQELKCADMNYALPVPAWSVHLCMSIGVFLEGHCDCCPKALGNVLVCLAAGVYAVISIRQQHLMSLREEFLAVIADTGCTIEEESVCAYLGPVQARYMVLKKGLNEAGRPVDN